MSRRICTVAELDAAPNMAVVLDHDCQVWQKIMGKYANIAGEPLEWFKTGEGMGPYKSAGIALPARILDDGR